MIVPNSTQTHAVSEFDEAGTIARLRADDVTGLSVEEIAAFSGTELVQSTGDRIRLRREALGRARGKKFVQQELADTCHVSKASVSAWETSGTGISDSNLAKLAIALECSVEWLQTGKGMEPSDMDVPPKASASPAVIKSTSLIVRGTVPVESGDVGFTGHVVGYAKRPPGLADARNAYVFQMRSNSMAPLWENGSQIYADPARPYQIGDYVVAELKSTEGTQALSIVRRVIFQTDDSIEFWQSRPDKRQVIKLDRIAFVHRILRMAELFPL